MLQRLLVLLVTAVGITASTLAQQLPESKPVTKPFVHPGVLHSRAELDFIKDKIARGEQPWLAAWGKLQSSQPHRSKRLGTTRSDSRSNSERKRSGSRSRSRRHVAVSSLDYKPSPRAHVERGPSNNPNIGSSDFSHDSIAAYSHALQWQLTGEKAHAEKAIEILNAWSGTLESVSGHDARLLIGMAGIGYCNAAELVRHSDADWKAEDQDRFEQMLRKIFYPTIENFYPSANGNWDASMIQTMLAMGVYLDDRKMFDRAANYFLHGQGNGAIENYFNAFGECQESGRDQAHTQMGIGFLGAACEIAWKQGVDLYSAADSRLALGFEYTAKYNLGHDVRYEPFKSFEGRYHYRELSDDSRGRFAPIYERIVHHYHDRIGLEMPYSREVAQKRRPEGMSTTHSPWGTLLFYGLPTGLNPIEVQDAQTSSDNETGGQKKNTPPKKKVVAYDASVPKPTLTKISYGDHRRNHLDFWKAKSDSPTPLVFVIHGGGWNGGSKELIHKFVDTAALLEAGISVAAINYRLIKHSQEFDPPVKGPLADCARALQFVRSKAEQWNIDKNRIGAAGGSAGACSSLWLAWHDDLADPKSDDAVERESTRLTCVAVTRPQTTLDPKQMKQWIPNSKYGAHAFGIKGFPEFLDQRDNLLPKINEYSPYALLDSGDAPTYMFFTIKPDVGKKQKDPTHSANFGVKMQERCREVGVACEIVYPGHPEVTHKTPTDYLLAMLKNPEASSTD